MSVLTRTVLAAVPVAAFTVVLGVAAAQDPYDFEEVTSAWGVDFLHAANPAASADFSEIMGSGACVFDYDADGWEDLLLVNGRYRDADTQTKMDPRTALYRNVGGTGFEKVEGALAISTWGMGCATGDYDNDDDQDVAISAWGGTVLYRNDGGGAFTNVTGTAGIFHDTCGRTACFSSSLAWLDYDEDKDLDLYVTNYVYWDGVGVAVPLAYGPGQCNVMWRNNGDGTFTNASVATGTMDCGLQHLALAIADVDGNGYQDIFVASDETVDTFLLNNGDGTFTDRSTASGLADRRGGMGTAWGDYNEDGRYDLVITHFEGERFALYDQGDDLTFLDRAEFDGLVFTEDYVGWGTEFFDYDRDGHLDLATVNGHVNMSYNESGNGNMLGYDQRTIVMRNTGNGRFENVTNDVFHPVPKWRVSRGLAIADFNRDGYPEMVVANNANQTANVWRSARGANNYVSLRLDGGENVNPHALGAVVEIDAGGRTTKREVTAASSYLSQSSRDLVFGLGRSTLVARLNVTWPDGTTQEFKDVLANRHFELSPGGALKLRASRPIATVDPVQVRTDRLTPISLTGEVVVPAEGFTTEWRILGDVVPGNTLARTMSTLGNHQARFRVTDANGLWDEANVSVLVQNILPTADATIPSSIERQATVTFDASGSTDRDGTIVSYAWIIDGVVYSGVRVTHTFETAGTFDLSLTVTDSDGGSDVATYSLLVGNAPPRANAGPDRLANLVMVITFDGSGSRDPDGFISSWSWNFGDGTTGAGERVDKQYAREGVFTVTLTVTDNEGAKGTDTAIVTVGNLYPVADAGADRRATRIAAVTFDGSASSDPDGSIASFAWDFGDGITATGAVVTHTYAALGAFTATLTVTDDDGYSASDTVKVTVDNLAPKIGAGTDVEREGLGAIAFTGTGSDPDGTVTRWTWDFGDGLRADGRTTTHAYLAYGRYVAALTATDNDGGATTAERRVWVYAKPVARPDGPAVTDRITDAVFDGTASTDADGRVVRWSWDFGDGTRASGPVATKRFARLGTFDVALTVTDDDGWTGRAILPVTVVNLPPAPAISGHPLVNLNQSLPWSGEASADPDGAVVAWSWNFGDATAATGARAEKAFTATGARVVRLTVTDDDGASATSEFRVDAVDWLTVAVVMDRATYGPTDRVAGTAMARYANGMPVPDASVDVQVLYRVEWPPGSGLPQPSVEVARAFGRTGADGTFEFEVWTPVPPIVTPPVGFQVATTSGPVAAQSWGSYAARADVEWAGNRGAGVAEYSVQPFPTPWAEAGV